MVSSYNCNTWFNINYKFIIMKKIMENLKYAGAFLLMVILSSSLISMASYSLGGNWMFGFIFGGMFLAIVGAAFVVGGIIALWDYLSDN